MLAPKKSLGQNFLQDENIVRKIVESVQPEKDDIIVEIGPGKGALTKRLLQTAGTIVGIELDKRAVELLREGFSTTVEIIYADVLDVDLHAFSRRYGKKLRIVGNIPYYITSEILFWLFDHHTSVNDATLMMQLEVAKRLVAPRRTKDYGILSIFTDFYTKPKLLFKVSRNSFYPKPNVDSAVVRLEFKKQLPECNIPFFRNVVRSTFGKRRKTLRNGLKYMGLTENELKRLDFDLKQRPEELKVEDFIELTKQMEKFEMQNSKQMRNSKY